MEIINVAEAKAHLSQIIEDVLNGKEIALGKRNKPLVTLKPFVLPESTLRKGGQWEGQIWMSDDFDAQDAEIERLFNDGPIFPD